MPETNTDDRVEEAEEAILSEPLLVVRSGGRFFALPMEQVLEVVTARPFAPLPGSPEAVSGLVNVRGRAVTVVDLGTTLGLDSSANAADHRVLLLEHRGLQIGLVVDDVDRILRVPEDQLVEVQESGAAGGWLRAVAHESDREIGVLEADRLLHDVLA